MGQVVFTFLSIKKFTSWTTDATLIYNRFAKPCFLKVEGESEARLKLPTLSWTGGEASCKLKIPRILSPWKFIVKIGI